MAKKITSQQKGDLFLHADGDSFFVACELTVRPELKGRPVIVGGDRGIAVAMSKEAKKLGITRGMPTFKIRKLYPEVLILNHNFELYKDIATKMHQILLSYFTDIEEYSIDECFARVRPEEVRYMGGEENLMRELKNEIEETLNVTYSLGLARTKALSKLASKLEKPGGLVMLLNKEDEIRALQATPIDNIWGIGWRTVPQFKRLGLKTAYDFVNFSEERIKKGFARPVWVLKRELGGESILEVEHNVDPRSQKSIQSTRTFHPASTDPKIIWREIAENSERACVRARGLKLLSNYVSFFLKTSGFKYYFDELKLSEYTADPGIVLNALEPKLARLLPDRGGREKSIRSTGVILHNLVREEEVPLDLFGGQAKAMRRVAVEEAADKIREKHGPDAIRRLASLKGSKSAKDTSDAYLKNRYHRNTKTKTTIKPIALPTKNSRRFM